MKEASVWSPVSGQVCLATPMRRNSSEGGVGHAGWGGNEVGEGEKKRGEGREGVDWVVYTACCRGLKERPYNRQWPP